MIIDVTMPQLGESVSEGTITKWLVREGDVVQKDQGLLEVSTDKADTELPAPTGGRIAKIVAGEGQVVAVGAVVCQVEEGVTASSAPSPSVAPAPAAAADNGETPAAKGAKGTPLATPTVRKTALENDVDLEQVRGSGDRGRITRDDVMRAAAGDRAAPAQSASSSPTVPFVSPPSSSIPSPVPEPLAPPAARPAQLAQMVNQGGGFVPPIPGAGYGSFRVPPYRPQEGDRVVPFTRRRRITADHMVYSKFSSPHVVTVAEVDVQRASRLRDLHKDRYKKEGHSLTMLSFVVVAAARALREYPELNARVLEDSYVILRDVNLGVAVDSPEGLVVPVVRRVDELGLRGIVRVIDDLAKKAKSGKISIDDLSGATFSITNPGLKGNLFGGAIINQPNVGILRMGEIQKRVVVVEGPDGTDHMAIHPVMFMALSYDHRIVDGVAANSFLWRVTELIEKSEFDV